MKKMNLKSTLAVMASGVLALTLLAGCGKQPSKATRAASEEKAAGTLLLSVNPEIKVEYDDGGLVLEIEGVNDDGRSIVTGMKEYQGKDCRTVVNELVMEVCEAGYFDVTVDGHTKNIVLKLEEGSVCPDDDFLEEVAEGAREAVKTYDIGSETMTVQEEDLDDKGYIGQDKAKELVLAQLGLTSASFNDHEYELDDGVYEFEFSANGVTYEYEVDALTGKILEADFEDNDDWDDADDWDDWKEFDNDQDDDHDDTDDKDDDRDDADDKDDDRDDTDDQDDDRDDTDDKDDDRDDADDKDDDRDDTDDKDDDRDDADDQDDDRDDADDQDDDRDDTDDQDDDRDDTDDQDDDADDNDD